MKFDSNVLKSLSLISQVGISMAVPIIGCMLIGNFIDKAFNTGSNIFNYIHYIRCTYSLS